MKKEYYAVIMAGGVGSRFWPVSTREFPKQFHDMLGVGQSLIQRTFDRINGLVSSEKYIYCHQQTLRKFGIGANSKVQQKSIVIRACDAKYCSVYSLCSTKNITVKIKMP